MNTDAEMRNFMEREKLTAAEALEKLKEGNQRYLTATTNPGDISAHLRKLSCDNGQSPYAIIVTCSDSRVIPESIFSAGIGELFVIRVAGNVMDDYQIGSVEYAAEHLGSPVVVVMGHDHCGAIDTALNHEPGGYIKYITDEIRKAIGDEKDAYRASCLNIEHSVSVIKDSLALTDESELKICAAIYHIADGSVEFLN